MTLRSLRKLRITQSNTLRQIIDAVCEWGQRIAPCALAATAAVLLTAPLTPAAQPPGFAGVPGSAAAPLRSTPAVPTSDLSVPLPPVDALEISGGWHAAQPQPDSTTPAGQFPARVSPPDVAAVAERQLHPTAVYGARSSAGWRNSHRRRISAVLNGHAYTPDAPLSEYWQQQSQEFADHHYDLVNDWHRESVRFQHNHRHIVVETKGAIQELVVEMRSPDEFEDGPDAYDTNSIIAELGPVRTASSAQADETSGASRRLTRDITTISPSLGYALRGIDENQLPDDFYDRMDNGSYVARDPAPTVLQWAPTNLWHHPLYFEDPALERYGHTYHPIVQPFASSARFTTQLVGLPYQMAIHPVRSRQYTLGWYRPGDHAPKLHYQVPFNQEAALTQAAAIAGMLIIFP